LPTLHTEHQVADYSTRKRNAFDADPLQRATSGVTHHRICRGADDPNHVMIDLEFNTMPEAEAMHSALRNLWQSPLAQIGSPTAQIIEMAEEKQY
jgi:hypothetical protein